MNIIHKERGTGRTTELIKRSAETHEYIVTLNRAAVLNTQELANKMMLSIPCPLTFDEFIRGKYYSRGIKGFLIDNADIMLEYISQNVPINAITLEKEKPKTIFERVFRED